MSENIEKLNKQVASFMLLSLALSLPSIANPITTTNTVTTKGEYSAIVAKYAAPQMPIGEITPIRINPPAISMYAAPQIPIREINPQNPEPAPIRQIISMYAAPHFPIKPIDQGKFLPIQREKSLKSDPREDLNNSLINIEKNTNKLQKRSDFNNASYLKKSDVVKDFKNSNEINNIAKNPNKTSSSQFSKVQSGEFIYTNYGNYRTIEPLSYSFFK